MPPIYRIPGRLLAAAGFDLLRGAKRSFRRDARLCVAALRPPIQSAGLEHIPTRPCVVTINHFSRPGFPAWWLALAVSAIIPAEVHWLVTAAWTFPGRPWAGLGEHASRLILGRLARMYAFTGMPPMPPRPHETQLRAQAVRRLVGNLRRDPSGWIGLAPEGQDSPDGTLQLPPPGSGRLLLLLGGMGLQFLPAGVYEHQERLHVCFGAPYRLSAAPELAAAERDRHASRIVMQRLAELLPAHLQGAFNGQEELLVNG